MKLRHEFLYGDDGEPLVYWWTQNLTGDWYPRSRNQRSIAWHGRAWLSSHVPRRLGRTMLGVEWSLGKHGLALRFALSDDWEQQITASVELPGAAVYVNAENNHLRTLLRGKSGTFSAYVYLGELWFMLWGNPMEGSRADPWWRRMYHFSPKDALFGRQVYSELRSERRWTSFVLPEGAYGVQCREVAALWKRKRLPWYTHIRRWELTPDRPIPLPDKYGEEDCIYEFTTAAGDMATAIDRFRASILDDRERRGGKDWQPRAEATV